MVVPPLERTVTFPHPDLWQNKILTRSCDADLHSIALSCKFLNRQVWMVREKKGLLKTYHVSLNDVAKIDHLPPFSKLVIDDRITIGKFRQLMKSKRVATLVSMQVTLRYHSDACEYIAQLPALKYLTLEKCQFTASQLNKLTNIQELSLRKMIPPKGEEAIVLPKVTRLRFIDTDDSLSRYHFVNLEYLEPPTYQGGSFAELFKCYPQLKIYTGFKQNFSNFLRQLVGASAEVVQYAIALKDSSGSTLFELLDKAKDKEVVEINSELKALVARQELHSVLDPKALSSMLAVALKAQDFIFFKELLELGADPNHIVNGVTALQRVIHCCKSKFVENYKQLLTLIDDLLTRKADPNIAPPPSVLPLFIALANNNLAIAKKLLTAPCAANIRLHSPNVFLKESEKWAYLWQETARDYFKNSSTLSCLQMALWTGNDDLSFIASLLQLGADVNQENDLGHSLFQLMLEHDLHDVLGLIPLQTVNPSRRDRNGRTASDTLIDRIHNRAKEIVSLESYLASPEVVLLEACKRGLCSHKYSDPLIELGDEPRRLAYRLGLLFSMNLSRLSTNDATFCSMSPAKRKELADLISKEMEILKKLKAPLEKKTKHNIDNVSIQNELDFLVNPTNINLIKLCIKQKYSKWLQSIHQNFSLGTIIDDRGFTLLHLVAEAGTPMAATFLGDLRRGELAIEAKDGAKPKDVAIERLIAARRDDIAQERVQAEGIIATFATIKYQTLRPLKKARASMLGLPAESPVGECQER